MVNMKPGFPFEFLLTVLCFGSVGIALALQRHFHLEPCPLCILQRIALLLLGVAVLLGRFARTPLGWRLVQGSLALAGLGVASWHQFLQQHPDRYASCAPDLGFALENLGLARTLPLLFRATGSCLENPWTLAGVTFPELSITTFLFCLALLGGLVKRDRAQRGGAHG